MAAVMGSNSVARVGALIFVIFPTEAFDSKHLRKCLGTIRVSDSSPGPVKSLPPASWVALIRSWKSLPR